MEEFNKTLEQANKIIESWLEKLNKVEQIIESYDTI